MKIGLLCSDGMFSKHRSGELIGSELRFLSKELDADILSFNKNCYEPSVYVSNLDEYDIIINFISSLNFFGGEVNPIIIDTFKALHRFKGKLILWYEDTNYPAVQLSDLLRTRKFWLENPLCDLEELTLPPIYVVGMFNDFDKSNFKNIDVISYTTIPVYITHLDDRPTNYNDTLFLESGKEVDLIYGGFSRKGKRNKFYNEFFLSRKNISVELYGDLSKDINDNIHITPRIPYYDVIAKNSSGLATVIPAEVGYNDNCITPRIIEAMAAECICFIQDEFDTKHSIMKDDFFYIKSGDELESKILKLKEDTNFYNTILNKQNNVFYDLKNVSLKECILSIK